MRSYSNKVMYWRTCLIKQQTPVGARDSCSRLYKVMLADLIHPGRYYIQQLSQRLRSTGRLKGYSCAGTASCWRKCTRCRSRSHNAGWWQLFLEPTIHVTTYSRCAPWDPMVPAQAGMAQTLAPLLACWSSRQTCIDEIVCLGLLTPICLKTLQALYPL